MAFSEIEQKRIEKALSAFLEQKRPPVHIRKELDFGYRMSGQSVELFEIRPKWNDSSIVQELPFAKTTYIRTKKAWKIFWHRADLRWHRYTPFPESTRLDVLLQEIDEDPNACFFG